MISRRNAALTRSLERLSPELRRRAQVAFQHFSADPSAQSLRFKKVGEPDVYSARVTDSLRALGYLEGDTITWFWIGPHDDYMRIIRSLR